MAATDDMPAELATALDTFEKALADVEAALQPLLATNMEEFLATAKPADKARVEVMAAYALSSLFYSTAARPAPVYTRTRAMLSADGPPCSVRPSLQCT